MRWQRIGIAHDDDVDDDKIMKKRNDHIGLFMSQVFR